MTHPVHVRQPADRDTPLKRGFFNLRKTLKILPKAMPRGCSTPLTQNRPTKVPSIKRGFFNPCKTLKILPETMPRGCSTPFTQNHPTEVPSIKRGFRGVYSFTARQSFFSPHKICRLEAHKNKRLTPPVCPEYFFHPR